MRTDTNVADGDTPPASAAMKMNKQLHPNYLYLISSSYRRRALVCHRRRSLPLPRQVE